MIQLITAEMKKTWGSRFFLITLAGLLCVNLFLLWFGANHAAHGISAGAYQKMEHDLAGLSMEEKKEFLDAKLEQIKGLNYLDHILYQEALSGGRLNTEARKEHPEIFEAYEEQYRNGGFLRYGRNIPQEYRFLEEIYTEFMQTYNYEAFLDEIEEKAKKLSSISIFTHEGYHSENIAATAKAFSGMRGTEISYMPQKGIVTALDFQLTDLIAVLVMVLIATVLVREERDNGLLRLIRSTPAGRIQTGAAKLFSLTLSLGVILFCLYGMNLLYCQLAYGLGPLQRTMQSVPHFMRSTWKITLLEYIGAFFFTKWLAACICGTWVMLSMLLAKKLFRGICWSLAFLGCHLLLYLSVPETSVWNVLKYSNFVSLLRVNDWLGAYRNLYWFGHPVSLLSVAFFSAALFAALLLTAFLWVYQNHYFTEKQAQRRRRYSRRKKTGGTTVLRQELHKLLMMQGAGFALVLFAVFQIYTVQTTENYSSIKEMYRQYYLTNIEGTYTKEDYLWLQEQQKEFEPIYKLNREYQCKKISAETYKKDMEQYSGLQEKQQAFEETVYRVKALKEKPHMQLVYETGWNRVFDMTDEQDIADTLWLALLCAVCFSGFFAMEQQTGMIKVIAAAPLGREYTVKRKLYLSAAVCLFLTVFSMLPRFWISVRDYGLGAWTAPLYSIPQFADATGIPLFLMVLLMFVLRFSAVFFMAVVTLALSQRLGNHFGGMFLSLLLFAVPPLLSASSLTGAKWLSVYPMLHHSAMYLNHTQGFAFLQGILAVLLTVLCIYDLMEQFGKEKT